jgi:iron(III) transport system substrate-binding protein
MRFVLSASLGRARLTVLNVATLISIGFAGLTAGHVWAAEPAPSKVTPELIAAATKEGKVSFYTSVEVVVAERIAKAFETKYPGIKVQVERTGSERVLQRLAQEYASKIYACDVVSTSDAAHFINWKKDGILAAYVPEDVALHFPASQREPDGMYLPWRSSLSVIAYNTKLVKPEDAPKSFADLLDPKWAGRLVKAHPSYSGTIVTATFQTARDIGWDFFEKLAKQKVMQVQSSTEPPKKVAQGERRVMVDGNEYVAMQMKEAGEPIEIVYAKEGSPMVVSPSAILKDAPNPNAARLFQSYMHSLEGQQLLIDIASMRSFHSQTKDKSGLMPLKDIKVMKEDPAAVADQVEKIKERYTSYFGT